MGHLNTIITDKAPNTECQTRSRAVGHSASQSPSHSANEEIRLFGQLTNCDHKSSGLSILFQVIYNGIAFTHKPSICRLPRVISWQYIAIVHSTVRHRSGWWHHLQTYYAIYWSHNMTTVVASSSWSIRSWTFWNGRNYVLFAFRHWVSGSFSIYIFFISNV